MSEIKEKKAGLLARDIGYFYEGEDVVFTITLRAKDGSFVDADSVLVTIKDSLGNAKAEDAPAERTAPGLFRYKYGGTALSAGKYRLQCRINLDGDVRLSDVYEFTIREAL